MTTTHLSRKDYFCALAVVVIWGTNFVAMKVGMRGLSPMLLGALRFALAAFPLILFVRAPRLPWRWVAAYGLVQGLGQFGLLFTALKFGMPSCMSARSATTGSGWAWRRWGWRSSPAAAAKGRAR
jgi:O-acetylserine/cysteine efflux transporter